MSDSPKKNKIPKNKGELRGPQRRGITAGYYEDMLQAYRDTMGPKGPRHTEVAKIMGVSRQTTMKAWTQGYPNYSWAPPIKQVIESENALARRRQALIDAGEVLAEFDIDPDKLSEDELDAQAEARRQAHFKAIEERKKAQELAVQVKAEEASLVQGTRRGVMGSMGNLLKLQKAMGELATQLGVQIQKEALKDLTVNKGLGILRKYALAMKDAANAARTVLELERVLMGEPTAILGIQVGETFAEAPMEAAIKEIEKAAKAVARARESGQLGSSQEGSDSKTPPSVH